MQLLVRLYSIEMFRFLKLARLKLFKNSFSNNDNKDNNEFQK